MVWTKFDESVVFEQLSVRRVEGQRALSKKIEKSWPTDAKRFEKIEKISENFRKQSEFPTVISS